MKIVSTVIGLVLALALTSPASAKHYHHKSHKKHVKTVELSARSYEPSPYYSGPGYAPNYEAIGTLPRRSNRAGVIFIPTKIRNSADGVIGGRPSQCVKHFRGRLIPYCGCEAARYLGLPNGSPGQVGPLDLASNWSRFPPAVCAPGNAAWRHGHVFVILSCNGDGTAQAHDGNSGGGLTREHRVSLAGYHIVSPGQSRYASK